MYTILIVDDQKSHLQRFTKLLSGEEEWLVIAAVEDGETAIKVIDEDRPDIVFTDIVLPKLGGVELVEYIRSIDGYRPVIYAISDLGGSALKKRLNELEVDCYSYKSVSDRAILSNLYMALDEEFLRPSYQTDEEYLESCVDDFIRRMGVPQYYMYSNYMADAILIHMSSGEELVLTKTIFPEIAKKRYTSASAIDSGLRLFIKNAAKKKSDLYAKVFGTQRRRVTSSDFIQEAAKYLKQNMKEK